MNIENGPELAARLQEPFDPKDVDFLPQGELSDEGKGRVVAYVDARVVAARFDEIFGPLGWSFHHDPLIMDGAVRVVRGIITIGETTKQDIGDSNTQTEPSKTAVSDALKRTAVLYGVGRYLYALRSAWVKGKPVGKGKGWVPLDTEIERLRAALPRPANMLPPIQQAPGHTERPATPSGVQSPASGQAAASAPRVVPAAGDPLMQVKKRINRKMQEFAWQPDDLLKVMRAHVRMVSTLEEAHVADWDKLMAVLDSQGLNAHPDYADFEPLPIGLPAKQPAGAA